MNQAQFPGSALRARREEMGFTLRDVHRLIHVPLEHLEALESGHIDRLPATAYATGFLLSYCQCLELDPDPFIDQYRLCLRSMPAKSSYAAFGESKPSRPPWLSEVITWGTICAVLLLGWVTYSAVIKPWAESAGVRVEAGTLEFEPPAHIEEGF